MPPVTAGGLFSQGIKLDIGCGKPGWQKLPLDEWIHLDIVPHDHVELVTNFGNIPLQSGQCSELWLGDVVEHIPVWERASILTEWNRVLALGGKVSGQTPNPDRCIRDYMAGTMSMYDLLGALYGKGESEWEVHYLTYSKEMLTELMAGFGFEINDFSESPGPVNRPWWLRFNGKKIRNL